MSKYEFTNNWFEQTAKENFERILPAFAKDIGTVIEIGCYEGQATVWMLKNLNPFQMISIDSWKGGAEHTGIDMKAVFERFKSNIKTANSGNKSAICIVGESHRALASLISLDEIEGNLVKKQKAGFIYVDGSHIAKDVLRDACMAYELLKDGGIMAFDDYTWTDRARTELNPLDNPRLAIDAFYNIYRRNLQIIPSTASQFWVMKRE